MPNPKAIISTDLGDMTVELWTDVAPNHVTNFLKLGRSGFYNNLSFHRIIPGFVVQGGCPKGDGTGGPGHQLKNEFNKRQHVPGTLSMARSSDPDSAGSQFFICLTREKCRSLDGQYTAFGQVVTGMDVVEKLGKVKTGAGDRPLQPVKLRGVKPIEGEKSAVESRKST
jgi:peptidyl-prolyl cis-trans isomerase B (cyclophilin B)